MKATTFESLHAAKYNAVRKITPTATPTLYIVRLCSDDAGYFYQLFTPATGAMPNIVDYNHGLSYVIPALKARGHTLILG